MSETTETPVVAEEAPKRPSMAELLALRHQRTNGTEEPPQAEKKEPEAPKVEAKVEAPKVEAKKVDEKVEKAPEEKKVPLKALHEARMENRELKAKLKKLEEQLQGSGGVEKLPYQAGGYWNEPSARSDTQGGDQKLREQYIQDKLVLTVNQVRRERKDADEIFSKFDTILDELDTERKGAGDETYATMVNSADPGHYMVDFVEQYDIQKKYGTDPRSMKEKIREELEKEVTEKVTQGLKTKTNVRASLPADFTGSRAASGGEVPYNRPTTNDLYNRRKRSSQT